jgi:hypothetical protein
MEWLIVRAEEIGREIISHLSRAEFYVQVSIIALALAVGLVIAAYLSRRVKIFREEPQPGAYFEFRSTLYRARSLLRPVSAAVVLGIAAAISAGTTGESWLIRAAQGVAFVFVVYSLAKHFLQNATISLILK